MKTTNVKLPSGAVIEIRKISLRDENFLAGAARSKRKNNDKVLIEVMSRCTIGFVEPGPYKDVNAGDKVKWDDMLSGDWFGAMIELRKFSYREGSSYDIQVQCPALGCNNKFGWKVDLDKDLFVKGLPEESVEAMAEGKPLSTTIDGRVVEFNLGYVKDNEAQDKLEKRFPGREVSCMLRSRIVSVEGVERQDILTWLDGLKRGGVESTKYEGLCSDDTEDLRAAFEEVDCGVDTEVEVECTKSSCSEVFTLDLPFDNIFTPARAAGQRRARRESPPRKEESERQSED